MAGLVAGAWLVDWAARALADSVRAVKAAARENVRIGNTSWEYVAVSGMEPRGRTPEGQAMCHRRDGRMPRHGRDKSGYNRIRASVGAPLWPAAARVTPAQSKRRGRFQRRIIRL